MNTVVFRSGGAWSLVLALLVAGGARVRAADAGLRAEYFDNADFTTLRLTTTNATVNFDWGPGAPATNVAADTFSVRWSGQVEPRFSETHTFHVTADDGARLWVNDRLLAARTVSSAAGEEISGRIALQAGQRVNLMLEFIEQTGPARVQLGWSSPSQPREIIPASQLHPALALPERGSLLQESWLNVAGTNVAALTNLGTFPARPDARHFLVGFESLQRGWADQHGARVSGWLVPPASGDYRFAVAADETAQLFLGTNAEAASRRLIATAPAPTGFRQFTTFPAQVSAPVSLLAGQKYFVELLHKEGAGDDYFAVAWQPPGAPGFSVIPADALVPAGLHLAPPAQGSLFNTLCASHPRLLASPEQFEGLRRVIASNSIPQLGSWWRTLSNSAHSILSQAPNQYVQDERDTILGVSRSVLDRVQKLALAWQVTGQTNFAERAWTELEAAANFPDWHPAHFLDTAEMTHAFAIGYDWLHAYWTPARRDALRNAIVTKGLNQSLTIYTNLSSWAGSGANNWNLVCNGGMVLGALAVGTEHESLAEFIVSRAVTSAGAVMRHYTTDNGGWYEGPGYWDYTTDYNMRLLAALETALGSDFSLSDTCGVWDTGLFALGIVGPLRQSFNFADASAGNLRGPQLFWLARRYHRPELAWYQRTNASPEVLDLLWYDARGSDPASSGLAPDFYFRGPTGATPYAPADAVTLRTRWLDADATFAGFKAGELGASHGNLDAGSFVLDALGRRWAQDLGADSYALPGYFGSARWTYYRLRAEGHNTLVINPDANPDQTVGAKPPVILFQSAPEGDRSAVVADLTSAYGISRVWRGLALFNRRRWVLVQDELQAAAPATVWWFMHLRTNTAVSLGPGGDEVMLSESTDRLWLKVLAGGGAFAVSNAVPLPTSPNPTNQNPNTGYRKLALRLTGVTDTTLAVLMVPLNPGENPPTQLPPLTPLRDWAALAGATNTPPQAWTTQLTAMAGATVDLDLRTVASDLETAAARLRFAVSNATLGHVTLLPDGHTARFSAPALFEAPATFDFAVTDDGPDPRLLLHYSFEPPLAAGATSVFDASGRYREGALDAVGTGAFAVVTNAPDALAPFSQQALRLSAGASNNAARLSGSLPASDYDLSGSDWTLSAWFRRESSTSDDFLFYAGSGDGFSGSGDELQLYCPRNQRALVLTHWSASGGSTADLNLTSPALVTNGTWRHAAVGFARASTNAGTVRLYLDGTLAAGPATITWALNQSVPLRCGGHASTTFATDRWFDGFLDDVALFRAALTASEVSALARQTVGHFGGLSAGATVTVAPPEQAVLLVSTGAVWRFHDANLDLGTAWRAPGFDDRAWKRGFAQLGFGDGDETTLVASNGQITTYFRREFVVPDAARLVSLTGRLLRDDGAAVYLNGVEVWRSNLPTNELTFATLASSSVPAGDESTNFHSASLSPTVLVNGVNTVAVEVHQSSVTSSDLSFDFELGATSYRAPANLPPEVLLTHPLDGATVVGPTNLALVALARDGDGDISRVEFYEGAQPIGQAAAPPFSVTLSNVSLGPRLFSAQAFDDRGAVAVATAAIQVVALTPLPLVPAGAVWRFRDDGADLGAAWRSNSYSDAGWKSGPAELGFGDGDEATLVASNRQVTTYFRRAFVAAAPALLQSLNARLLRDDGAVLYLNGTEIWRDNLPDTGPIAYTNFALAAISGANETNWLTRALDPALLRPGTNLLAAEIHQNAVTSSDLSFNFELTGVLVVREPPALDLAAASGGWSLSWSAEAAAFSLYTTTNLAPPAVWLPAANAPVFTNGAWRVELAPAAAGQRFFQLRWP